MKKKGYKGQHIRNNEAGEFESIGHQVPTGHLSEYSDQRMQSVLEAEGWFQLRSRRMTIPQQYSGIFAAAPFLNFAVFLP